MTTLRALRQHTLSKITNEPRKKLKKTSPEIKAKQGAEIRDPRPNSRGERLEAQVSEILNELRKKLKEASPEIKAKLEGGIARDQGEDESRNRETSPKDRR